MIMCMAGVGYLATHLITAFGYRWPDPSLPWWAYGSK